MRGLKGLTVLCVFSAVMFAADNPFIGTWKLNVAKSKFSPNTAMKEATMTFEADGDKVKRVMHATTADGQPMNQEGSVVWDGMPHKVDNPDGSSMMVAVKKVGGHVLDVTVKQNDKVIQTVKVSVSSDGK